MEAERRVVVQDGERVTYGIADRSAWRPGPWDDEPDKVQWIDEATGFHCIVLRQASHWCGYVGLPAGHPWREGEAPDGVPGVRAEINYGPNPCSDDGMICHDVEHEDDVHWLGFDVASGSQEPWECLGDRSWNSARPYHDLAYVRSATTNLAKAAASAGPPPDWADLRRRPVLLHDPRVRDPVRRRVEGTTVKAIPKQGDRVVDQDRRGQSVERTGVVKSVGPETAVVLWSTGRRTFVKITSFTTLQASRGYRIVGNEDNNKESP